MRKFLLSLALVSAALGVVAAQVRDDPRVILISIDGLMPSSYTSPTSPATTLRRLASEGIWSEGVTGVLPTVTYPSHTTLITGVDPAVHGIVDNRILDPEDRSNGAWHWYARDIKVPTLPTAARSRGLRAAAVTWPVTVGMDLDFVTPEYPRTRHIETLSLLRALSQPRHLLESVEIARGKPFDWPQTDRDRTDITKFILRTYDPHVLLLHLIALDGAQHTNGPDTPQAMETLAQMDAYVAEILDQVRASGRPTHVAIVSDHGFLPLRTLLQPNAAFKREGLITPNERGGVASWKAYYHASGGSGFVYVKDAADRARVHQILLALKQDPANGIREVWTADDLRKRGAHPEAAFGLDVVDGFYTGSGDDVLVKPSTTKGGHGFGPDRTALRSSFILTGPTVQRRGNIGVIRMTQIAPTLAKILGVGLSPEAAQPLTLTDSASTASR
jgi:predicted AlkP superfamily pyrophosphatase or phosphodiesterase